MTIQIGIAKLRPSRGGKLTSRGQTWKGVHSKNLGRGILPGPRGPGLIEAPIFFSMNVRWTSDFQGRAALASLKLKFLGDVNEQLRHFQGRAALASLKLGYACREAGAVAQLPGPRGPGLIEARTCSFPAQAESRTSRAARPWPH